MDERALRLRMCAADQKRYGGPEWVDYRYDEVIDLPFDEVTTVEDTIGFSMARLSGVERPRYTARGLRAMLWIARRMAGESDDWVGFKPNVQRLDVLPVFDEAGDAGDPPDPSEPADPDGSAGTSSAA